MTKPADPRAIKAWHAHRPNFFGTRTDKNLLSLAKHLGVSQAATSRWKQVPDYRLTATAAFLGVAESDLRPDLFPASSPWDELLS